MSEHNSLLIKGFPKHLSEQAIYNLLQHFGAASIKTLTGRLKGRVYVDFPDKEICHRALVTLKELDLWGNKLSVEFSQPDEVRNGAVDSSMQSVTSPINAVEEQPTKSRKRKREPHAISAKLGVNWTPSPQLEYLYPRPDSTIITNIMNALIAVPKFYTQVLHLMNKLNLPPPFGAPTATPPLKKRRREEDDIATSESELESDEGEEIKPKYPLAIPSELHKKETRVLQPPLPSVQIRVHTEDLAAAEQQIEASTQPESVSEEQEAPWITLSDRELAVNKISEQDIVTDPKFAKYTPGEPSARLYIKNLAKDVEMEDLYFIFGRYFRSRTEMLGKLDVRLMKEGRMKDQAFVTFTSKDLAVRALTEVHGYRLKNKPMIIAFGRSQ